MSTYSTITETDIRSFLKEPRAALLPLKQVMLTVAGFALGAAILYGALNAPALLYVNQIAPLSAQAQGIATPTPEGIAQAVIPAPTSTPTPVATATPEVPSNPNNTIAMADLGISAPITWDVSFDTKVQNKILPNSTIHLAGTAHPGQHGVVAISGHSSNYPWIKGAYNTVFAPLGKAKVDQIIEINYNNTLYRYQVTKVFVIKPTDTQYLADNGKDVLRLFTCTPIGTNLNRLVVEAQQIYPNPSANAAFTASVGSAVLPNDL